jgi:hypothetical protein
VNVVSISWGLDEPSPVVAKAIDKAYSQGIISLASASNTGANESITFPASLDHVFCIGSANGVGKLSDFNPPPMGPEKFSSLGEAVRGADVLKADDDKPHDTIARRTGTSTATPVAAGITALLLDYIHQFQAPLKDRTNTKRIRKFVFEMSKSTGEQAYRYLSLWLLFKDDSSSTRREFISIANMPTRIPLLQKQSDSARWENKKLSQVLEWVSPEPYNSRHEEIKQSRVDSCGQWFFQTDTYRNLKRGDFILCHGQRTP